MTGAPGGPTDRPLPAELARLLHDLRGPLNSAVMHLEVLKRTVAGDPTADESLRTVLQQLARLSDMLPVALGVAALEAQLPRAHDLKRLAEQARAVRGLATVTLGAGDWPRVSGDDALLVLAIGELLANAVEATPAAAPPPEVTATLGPDGRAALLQSTKPGHRGLGLVTVERVVRQHGGTLEFESLPDGARVTLRLPTAP